MVAVSADVSVLVENSVEYYVYVRVIIELIGCEPLFADAYFEALVGLLELPLALLECYLVLSLAVNKLDGNDL